MAQILTGGPLEFNASVFGRPHPGTMQFLSNYSASITQNLTDAGRRWMDTMKETFRWMDESEAARLARAVQRKIQGLWETDEIRPLFSIGQLQNPGPTMQRWLMAEPTTRGMFHKQLVDGYSESYVDIWGNVQGSMHYDYRRATDGLVMETEEGGWVATTYVEELLPDDRDLMLDEQADIQTAWESLRHHLKQKKDDPTSPWNSSL